jgi:GDP-L-fucose synthase
VEAFFSAAKPESVVFAAGRSGGIAANLRLPADLMLDNLLSAAHVLDAARRHGTGKLLYLASSCAYPRECPQPMRPGHLMTGPLEPSNEAYATAKIAGLVLCQALRRQYGAPFISAIPANAFGPGDDFSPEDGHVIASLLRRMHEAKEAGAPEVAVWGTGAPVRDFIFVDDLARACVFLLESHDGEIPVNVGSGSGTSIRELAAEVAKAVGYRGRVVFDPSRPDGMMRKVLDTGPLSALGFTTFTPLPEALAATYAWYRAAAGGTDRRTP